MGHGSPDSTDVRPVRRSALSTLAALALLLGCAALVVSPLPARWAGASRPWLGRAMRSDLFVACALVCLVGVAVVAVLAGALWNAGRRARRQRKPDSGVILIEFILLLPILLSVSLAILQAALLMGGLFAVNYSAWCGARAAIVQIPLHVDTAEPSNVLAPGASEKFERIFRATAWPLIPMGHGGSWNRANRDDGDLAGEIRRFYAAHDREAPAWADERLARKYSYVYDHTRVEISPPAEGQTYQANEDIRVDVEHTYYLSVPYAGWMVHKLSDDGVALDTGDGDYGIVIRAGCTMVNQGEQNWVDREVFD